MIDNVEGMIIIIIIIVVIISIIIPYMLCFFLLFIILLSLRPRSGRPAVARGGGREAATPASTGEFWWPLWKFRIFFLHLQLPSLRSGQLGPSLAIDIEDCRAWPLVNMGIWL